MSNILSANVQLENLDLVEMVLSTLVDVYPTIDDCLRSENSIRLDYNNTSSFYINWKPMHSTNPDSKFILTILTPDSNVYNFMDMDKDTLDKALELIDKYLCK